VDPKDFPARPFAATRQVNPGAEGEVRHGPPDADGEDSNGEHEVLHHRIHDGQHRDRSERGEKTLDRMRDSAHASAVAS
jgi:hypothetical protein